MHPDLDDADRDEARHAVLRQLGESMPAPTPTPSKIADLVAYQNRAPMTWKHVERYRELWKGNFVLKGIMHPDDAIRAHALGVDGLMVSNHGARQLDNAPSPLDVLPSIRDAVGDKMTLMLDGGIRRSLDAHRCALCTRRKVRIRRPADALWRHGGRHPGRCKMALKHLPPQRSTSPWRRWVPRRSPILARNS